MSVRLQSKWKQSISVLSLLFTFFVLSNAAQAAPCSTNCIRVFSIDVTDIGTSIRGTVKLWDETGSAGGTRSAVLHVVWTRPDGSTLDQYDTIGTRLRGEFSLYTAGTPGTYTLTVVDATRAGYTFDPKGSNILNKDITVGSVGNQPPKAVPNANVLSGMAPLAVSFDSSGSNDPDGSIVSYSWDFGDGNTSTEMNPEHTYLATGNFNATLTVADNIGATDSGSVGIVVTESGDGCQSKCMLIDQMSISYRKRAGLIKAKVFVLDEDGGKLANADVQVEWVLPSGSILAVSSETDKRSRATFSLAAANSPGVYTLQVVNVSLGGYTFEPSNSNMLTGIIEIAP